MNQANVRTRQGRQRRMAAMPSIAQLSKYPALLNTEQAAEILGITVPEACKLAREGRIPARKYGREWRFPTYVFLQTILMSDWIQENVLD